MQCDAVSELPLFVAELFVLLLEFLVRRDSAKKDAVVGSGVVMMLGVDFAAVEAGSCIPRRDWTKFRSCMVVSSLFVCCVDCDCLVLLRDESMAVALASPLAALAAVWTALAAFAADVGVSTCCVIPTDDLPGVIPLSLKKLAVEGLNAAKKSDWE